MANRQDVITHPFTLPFIQALAAKLSRERGFSPADAPDLEQTLLLYLWERSRLFDPSRGSIEAFVITSCQSCIGMERRRRRRFKRFGDQFAQSLEGTPIDRDGESDTLASTISEEDLHRRTGESARSPIEQLEQRDAITYAMRGLSIDDRALLIFVAKHGVAATARHYGVSRRQIENAVARMRSRFENAGLGPR